MKRYQIIMKINDISPFILFVGNFFCFPCQDATLSLGIRNNPLSEYNNPLSRNSLLASTFNILPHTSCCSCGRPPSKCRCTAAAVWPRLLLSTVSFTPSALSQTSKSTPSHATQSVYVSSVEVTAAMLEDER